MKNHALGVFLLAGLICLPGLTHAQSGFNPSMIISDTEIQNFTSWDKSDIQKFLDSKGSYLRTGKYISASGALKSATDIIYDASRAYQINPKFLLVTLQKEQSLITDDSPSQRQLDWATGYAVCDGCYLSHPNVQKFKGFGKQVDSAAGIIRWYYQNQDNPIVKKKDVPILIDNTRVTPASWATAFMYTYTPHLHGNANFWRIWNTWFDQTYPNGTILKLATASTTEYWVIENGKRRHFKTKSALLSRADPKLAISTSASNLENYPEGPEIAFPNYSLLRTPSTIYLLDYDTLRPFASQAVVRALGFNPDEPIDVNPSELTSYTIGDPITASTTAPQGVIIHVANTDLKYFLKDGVLHPFMSQTVIDANYKLFPVEKHTLADLSAYPTTNTPLNFNDGTLIQSKFSTAIYVIDEGRKRPIADEDTFYTLGYSKSNIIEVSQLVAMSIPTGERLYINGSLTSSDGKFVGDNNLPADDLYGKSKSASYLIAEYPSGRIISGKNIDDRLPISSLTKMLTAYEALQNDYSLTGSTVYSAKKFTTSTNPALKEGSKINNKDLLYSMLIASNNSAAKMIAGSTSTGENDLVRKINLRLGDWGADYTSIYDVAGSDGANKSTARDLLKIFTKILSDKNIKTALAAPSYTLTATVKNQRYSYKLKNTNQIFTFTPSKLNYKILASETGYFDQTGADLIMLIQSKKTNKQYIVITLGNMDAKNQFNEPNLLANWITDPKLKLKTN